VFVGAVKKTAYHPVALADGDDVILTPEDFHLLGFQETVPAVVMREMEDEEIIIVVYIDLGALIHTLTVFDVEGVKVEIVLQEAKVFVGRVLDVMPLKRSDFNGLDHDGVPLVAIVSTI